MKAAYDLAKQHAHQIQLKYPELFNDAIGIRSWKSLAAALNINIYSLANSDITGRLEVDENEDRILYNSHLSRNSTMQTIGHEIGHWILKKFHPELDKLNDIKWKEAYANHFATQLSIPFIKRKEIIKNLKNSDDVKVAVEYARKFCTPLAYFLNVMAAEDKEQIRRKYSHNIWLICKWGVDKLTQLDPYFRTYGGFFDDRLYNIPANKSLQTIVKDTDWLINLQAGIEKEHSTIVKLDRVEKSRSRIKSFRTVYLEVNCRVLKLNEKKGTSYPQIIILIKAC